MNWISVVFSKFLLAQFKKNRKRRRFSTRNLDVEWFVNNRGEKSVATSYFFCIRSNFLRDKRKLEIGDENEGGNQQHRDIFYESMTWMTYQCLRALLRAMGTREPGKRGDISAIYRKPEVATGTPSPWWTRGRFTWAIFFAVLIAGGQDNFLVSESYRALLISLFLLLGLLILHGRPYLYVFVATDCWELGSDKNVDSHRWIDTRFIFVYRKRVRSSARRPIGSFRTSINFRLPANLLLYLMKSAHLRNIHGVVSYSSMRVSFAIYFDSEQILSWSRFRIISLMIHLFTRRTCSLKLFARCRMMMKLLRGPQRIPWEFLLLLHFSRQYFFCHFSRLNVFIQPTCIIGSNFFSGLVPNTRECMRNHEFVSLSIVSLFENVATCSQVLSLISFRNDDDCNISLIIKLSKSSSRSYLCHI